jgi:hypothetical protein
MKFTEFAGCGRFGRSRQVNTLSVQPGPARRSPERRSRRCTWGRAPPSSFHTGRPITFPLMSHSAISRAAMACEAYPVCPRGDSSQYKRSHSALVSYWIRLQQRWSCDFVDYRGNHLLLRDGSGAVADKTGRGFNLDVAGRLPDLLGDASDFEVDDGAERCD